MANASAWRAIAAAKSGLASVLRFSRAATRSSAFDKGRVGSIMGGHSWLFPSRSLWLAAPSTSRRSTGPAPARSARRWPVPPSPLVLDLMGLQVQVGVVYPEPRSRSGTTPDEYN